MKTLLHAMKFDIKLLHRNEIIAGVAAGSVAAVGTWYLISKLYKYCREPKLLKTYPKRESTSHLDSRENVYKRFFYDDVTYPRFGHVVGTQARFDAIIIGSGMAGLTTAVLLSQHGKRVLVLEGKDSSGWSEHSFQNTEYASRLYYMGYMPLTEKIFNAVTEGNILYESVNNPTDVFMSNGLTIYKFNAHTWIRDLKRGLEVSASHISRMVNYLRFSAKILQKLTFYKIAPTWVAYFVWGFRSLCGTNAVEKYSNIKATDAFCCSPDAQSIFMCQHGLHGEHPKDVSLLVHGGALNHYVDGSWYPTDGVEAVIKTMCKIIRSAGGDVVVHAKVTKVLTTGTKAVGVVVNNSNHLFAKAIVSSIGTKHTLALFDQPNQSIPSIVKSSELIGHRTGKVTLFATFVGSSEDLNISSSVMWHHGQAVNFESFEEYVNSEIGLCISFPSTRGGYGGDKSSGAFTTCICSTELSYDQFIHFQYGTRTTEDETLMTDMLKEKILQILFLYYPQCKRALTHSYVTIPSMTDYGLALSKERFNNIETLCNLRPKTELSGFFLAGHDIFFPGAWGSLYSGAMCAHAILDRTLLSYIGELM